MDTDFTYAEFESGSKFIRYVAVIGVCCLFMKMSYFLSLLDPVAPLIDIIVQIFFDMKYFLLVLVLYMYMLSVCFKIIAQSQIDFDYIDEED